MASGGQFDLLQDLQNLLFVSRQDGNVTRYGGWKKELLVEDILSSCEEKLLLCTLCEGVLRDACVVNLDQKKQARCRYCLPANFRVYPRHKADLVRSVINERLVYCPVFGEGCDWTGAIIESQRHLRECQYLLIPCPLGCTSEPSNVGQVPFGKIRRIRRKLLSDHLSNSCPQRFISCLYCMLRMHSFSLNSHLTVCEEFPIQCKNRCTFESVNDTIFSTSRKLMFSHLQRECPLQPVICPYAQHGCNTRVVRRYAHQHSISFMRKHLELVESSLKETKISLAKQIDENRVLTKQLSLSNGGVDWSIMYVTNRLIRKKEFHSPPIYACGYKFRFFVQFNNQNNLGVNFSLLKGDKDDELIWPLKGEITFTLINKTFGSEYDHEQTISSEDHTTQEWFNKPTIGSDPSLYGIPHFISHEDLHSYGYIIDDSILLRVLLKCI